MKTPRILLAISCLVAIITLVGSPALAAPAENDGPVASAPSPVESEQSNGASYCPADVYGINQGTVQVGAPVVIKNVHVESVSGSTMVVTVEPADSNYQGPNGSSLTVDLGLLTPPPVGSRVDVIGVVQPGPRLAAVAVM